MELSQKLTAEITNFIKTFETAPDDIPFKELLTIAHLNPAADLIGTDLQDVDLTGEDLTGINFSECDCCGINWQGADIAGCSFENARFSDSWAIYLAKNTHIASY